MLQNTIIVLRILCISNIPLNLQLSLLIFQSPYLRFFFFTQIHCRANFWILKFIYECTIHARFLLLILHPSRICFTYHFQRNQTHVVKNFVYLIPCACSLPIFSRAFWWSHRSKFGIFYDTEAGETITFCFGNLWSQTLYSGYWSVRHVGFIRPTSIDWEPFTW